MRRRVPSVPPTLLVLAIVLSAAAAAAAADGGRPLAVDDYFALGDVDDPRLSPDGAWIAYTVSRRDLEADEVRSRLWMVPVAGGEAVPLTAPEATSWSPRWSPDGHELAFLSARGDDETQVWALDRRGGEARALTTVQQGVLDFAWSPVGRKLALVVEDRDPRDAEGDEPPNPRPWVIDRLQFKEDGVGYLDRLRDHLYVLDLDGGGDPVQITFGDFEDASPVWSPDGRSIAFVSNRTPDPDRNYDTDVWVVSAEGGTSGERPLRRVSDRPGADDSPTWSPDGTAIAYLSTSRPEVFDYSSRDLMLATTDGAAPRSLTGDLDRVMYRPAFDPDGQGVWVLLEDTGEQQLARVGLDGSIERRVTGRQVVWGFHPGADGRAALLVAEPDRPSEVYLLERAGPPRRLTHTNDAALAGIELGVIESFDATSPDGMRVQSFLVKPPGFEPGRRYPTILWIHGGPMGQYDWGFDFRAQLTAAQGYLVVLPNYRGSTGRGTEFSRAIWASWGDKDLKDNLAAVDWAIDRGLADPEALGIGGWSYGGMMTNHAITKTDRFDAAITGASAALYVANYGHDHYQRWWEQELGLPWDPESRAVYERLSPFNDVEKVTTPTLILCGESDWNVPVVNSEQLYQALKRLGKADTKLVVYPGEPHAITVPSYEKDRYERYLDWFGKYVK